MQVFAVRFKGVCDPKAKNRCLWKLQKGGMQAGLGLPHRLARWCQDRRKIHMQAQHELKALCSRRCFSCSLCDVFIALWA